MSSFFSRNKNERPERKILATVILVFANLMVCSPAHADKDGHDVATAAEMKAAVPLKKVIREIRKTYGGRLLKVELEKERIGGKYVLIYEAKVLLSDGAVLKLYYDARTMKLLKRKGRYKKRRDKKLFGFFSNFGRQNSDEYSDKNDDSHDDDEHD